ncbi:MAG: GSCFA domain-containing protein [Flavobacteriia bacterium]|nr:GSCFA domain-containing protein [Flavobacteriia bacterium]
MKWKLDSPIIDFSYKLSYHQKFAFIGSCFSSDIQTYFKNFGFDTINFPFGTIYHPSAIAQNLLKIIHPEDISLTELNGKIYHLDSNLSDDRSNEKNFISKINSYYNLLNEQLKQIDVLFITFGTAFAYHLFNQSSYIVANCHKIPSQHFEKKLSSTDDLISIWDKVLFNIKQYNPKLQIILTVSPVRHISDGLIQNNRSKSRCFELVEHLEKQSIVSYFPSYEILIDELRDYRFYKEDLIHPNSLAVQYIWEEMQNNLLHKNSKFILEEIEKWIKLKNHRVQNFENQATHQNKIEKSLSNLKNKYPCVRWDEIC